MTVRADSGFFSYDHRIAANSWLPNYGQRPTRITDPHRSANRQSSQRGHRHQGAWKAIGVLPNGGEAQVAETTIERLGRAATNCAESDRQGGQVLRLITRRSRKGLGATGRAVARLALPRVFVTDRDDLDFQSSRRLPGETDATVGGGRHQMTLQRRPTRAQPLPLGHGSSPTAPGSPAGVDRRTTVHPAGPPASGRAHPTAQLTVAATILQPGSCTVDGPRLRSTTADAT